MMPGAPLRKCPKGLAQDPYWSSASTRDVEHSRSGEECSAPLRTPGKPLPKRARSTCRTSEGDLDGFGDPPSPTPRLARQPTCQDNQVDPTLKILPKLSALLISTLTGTPSMLNRFLPVVALVSTSTGCSLALVDGPPGYLPPNEPVPMESCTKSRALPFVDAIGAGAFLLPAFTSSDGTEVRVSAVVGSVLGLSSFVGFRRVRHCRERVFGRNEESASLTVMPQATTRNAGPLLTAPRPVGATFLTVPRRMGRANGGRHAMSTGASPRPGFVPGNVPDRRLPE